MTLKTRWSGIVFGTIVATREYTMNDRFGIYTENEETVKQLAKRLKYSVDEVLNAVQEVGFDEEEIEEYIRDREERSLF